MFISSKVLELTYALSLNNKRFIAWILAESSLAAKARQTMQPDIGVLLASHRSRNISPKGARAGRATDSATLCAECAHPTRLSRYSIHLYNRTWRNNLYWFASIDATLFGVTGVCRWNIMRFYLSSSSTKSSLFYIISWTQYHAKSWFGNLNYIWHLLLTTRHYISKYFTAATYRMNLQ